MSDAGHRILLVEDNQDIREALRLWLELDGFDVQEAVDGVDALAALEAQPLPDLILLDMLMPRMNGWEFVSEIRKDLGKPAAKIPIVAITATSEKVQRTPGEIYGVLKKPFELGALHELLEKLFPKRLNPPTAPRY